MKYTLVIIGAGQLGSRHLQALALSEREFLIFVMDPSEEALDLAKSRFEEVKVSSSHIDVKYVKKISVFPHKIDLAIISTSSKIREQVLVELLEQCEVKYVVFEKFLFPKEESYFKVEELLIKNGVVSYVNCARRMWPFYQDLKSKFINATNIDYFVSGSNLGIGSNGIHFIDQLAFLTGCSDFKLYHDKLDDQFKASSRSGYIEFTGTLYGYSEQGDRITITSYATGNAPLVIIINSDKARCVIKEPEGKVIISSEENGWVYEEITFDYMYQSKLTQTIVEQLLDTGNCYLTTYKEASEIHITILKTFLKHLNKNRIIDENECLVT